MARGIIGKMIRGAAEAGVPMLQEEHRAQIQTRRDEALNRISQQNRREDQTFQREMNADNQKFEAGQRDMDRSARAEEFSATRADAAEERGMQREQLDMTAQQIAQTLEAGSLGIIEQRRLQGLYDTIANPESAPEQISQAITILNGLKGENPTKYQAITLYDDELDVDGNQRRVSGVLNQASGVVTPVSPSAGRSSGAVPGGTATPQTEAEWEALPSGAVYIDPEDGLTYRKP